MAELTLDQQVQQELDKFYNNFQESIKRSNVGNNRFDYSQFRDGIKYADGTDQSKVLNKVYLQRLGQFLQGETDLNKIKAIAGTNTTGISVAQDVLRVLNNKNLNGDQIGQQLTGIFNAEAQNQLTEKDITLVRQTNKIADAYFESEPGNLKEAVRNFNRWQSESSSGGPNATFFENRFKNTGLYYFIPKPQSAPAQGIFAQAMVDTREFSPTNTLAQYKPEAFKASLSRKSQNGNTPTLSTSQPSQVSTTLLQDRQNTAEKFSNTSIPTGSKSVASLVENGAANPFGDPSKRMGLVGDEMVKAIFDYASMYRNR